MIFTEKHLALIEFCEKHHARLIEQKGLDRADKAITNILDTWQIWNQESLDYQFISIMKDAYAFYR